MSRHPEFIPPKVEQGIAIPPPKRKPRARRAIPPSPWVAFVATLKAGDSFTTDFWDGRNMPNHFKRAGIQFEQRSIHPHGAPLGQRYYRFWVVENPMTYDPAAWFTDPGKDI